MLLFIHEESGDSSSFDNPRRYGQQIAISLKESQDGIEEIIKNKGLGYRGAELKDLKFDLLQDSSKTEFVFKSVGSVID